MQKFRNVHNIRRSSSIIIDYY